ncbi:MAG TPA: divalent cation tolerance protein CutA [archaeon]|nr:divalent cation tolerance protein CutA [archaeon]
MSYVVVYVTLPNRKSALRAVRHLLRKKLIACANIFPVYSEYWWKYKIEKAKEVAVLAKTTEKSFTHVEKEIKRLHPYELAVVEKIKVSANNAVEKWLKCYVE